MAKVWTWTPDRPRHVKSPTKKRYQEKKAGCFTNELRITILKVRVKGSFNENLQVIVNAAHC